MSQVTLDFVPTINSIKHKTMKPRQFQEDLLELESEYIDLLFYANTSKFPSNYLKDFGIRERKFEFL